MKCIAEIEIENTGNKHFVTEKQWNTTSNFAFKNLGENGFTCSLKFVRTLVCINIKYNLFSMECRQNQLQHSKDKAQQNDKNNSLSIRGLVSDVTGELFISPTV